jgi:stearoyl-CoA desaturase (delta-9 desaturase)
MPLIILEAAIGMFPDLDEAMVRPAYVATTEGLSPESVSVLAVQSAPPSVDPGFLGRGITVLLVVGPMAGLAWAVFEAWGSGLSAMTVGIAIAAYVVAGHGVTIGYHRYLTHGSFKAKRPLRVALAVAGCLSVEGGPISWVALHRRHHRFSDADGDPHSPYRFGTTPLAQVRGLVHAHVGWLFTWPDAQTEKYAPDLLADADIRKVDRLFPVIAVTSVLAPFFFGWVVSGHVREGIALLLWAGLVRIAVLHHVTWSVNSICHVYGRRPFRTRGSDRARNFWPLAVISLGDSWHNMHHAEPTCARHGVDPRQIDSSARVIRWFEMAGWAHDVRWPEPDRLLARRAGSFSLV